MASQVEHNRTWQMAVLVCFNMGETVNHVQGACGKHEAFTLVMLRGISRTSSPAVTCQY